MLIRRRIGVFCIRLAGILLFVTFLSCLPDIETGGVIQIKNVLVSLLTVILVGVALYDTFFYNRSRW
jgi:hypothetical protein